MLSSEIQVARRKIDETHPEPSLPVLFPCMSATLKYVLSCFLLTKLPSKNILVCAMSQEGGNE
jgi:hypothetical protein